LLSASHLPPFSSLPLRVPGKVVLCWGPMRESRRDFSLRFPLARE
jgi:hypothetical protein